MSVHDNDLARCGEQLKLERQLKTEAAARFRDRTAEAVDLGRFSTTVAGRKLVKRALTEVSGVMRDRWKTVSCRPGPGHMEITKLLNGTDFEVLAFIGLRRVLDLLISPKDNMRYTAACTQVGRDIQAELRMQFYADSNPGLFRQLCKSRFHAGSAAYYKIKSVGDTMANHDIVWQVWSPVSNARIGQWVLGAIQQATGWLEIDRHREGKTKLVNYLRVSETLANLVDTLNSMGEGMAFLRRPMLCQPMPWARNDAGDWVGGYLESEVFDTPLVRSTRKGERDPGPVALQAINHAQNTAYVINPAALEVARWGKKNMVGKIGDSADGKSFHYGKAIEPLGDFADPEGDPVGFKQWKQMKRKIYDRNVNLQRDNVRTAEIVSEAERFAGSKFWIPWNFDYRGRMYPLTSVLNPQGIDFEKSLFYFADEGPVNEFWLAFQVATTYGHDKLPLEERAAWTRANLGLISAIAEDPIGNLPQWESAGEPWLFMVACVEYHQCCIARTKTTSGLPIGIDATCSGLQHLAAMTLDASTGGLVNLRANPARQDAYKAVAGAAAALLPDEEAGWMDRKVTKRVVMTIPYGVSRHSARGYIKGALEEAGRDLSKPETLSRIVEATYSDAMGQVLPGPVAVMAWVKKAVAEATKGVDTDLRWVSPSGFEVVQVKRHPVTKEVVSQLFGGVNITQTVKVGMGKSDAQGHAASAAPNLVHSCDAALFHFVMSDVDVPLCGIHDQLLGRSCDMDNLSHKVRLHFCEMYRNTDVMADWARQVGIEPNPDLRIGDLDIEEVLRSEHFFS